MRWLSSILALAACAPVVDPAALRAQLTPAQVAQLRVPMVFVSGPGIGVAATLIPVRQVGDIRVWHARDGVQINTRGGLIIGTRGLGHDLMSADVNGAAAALAGGSASYTRRMTYLTGDLETTLATFACKMTAVGTRVHPPTGARVTVWTETCDGPARLENTYHRGSDGTIWWSRQWVSPQVAALEVETIRP